MKLLLALLLACSPALAEKVGDIPAPKAYVDDYAGILTAAGQAKVEAVCREVHDKTRAQIFVVIIKSLDGEPIAPFANDLFHNWKIGEKKTDRGILVLLVQDSHRWRIEVGYGLEGILPDAKAGRIGRAMDPLIKAGNYDAAARSSVDAVAAVIAEDAGVALAQPASEPEPVAAVGPMPKQENDPTGAIVAFAIICAFCLIALMRYLRRRPARMTGYPGNATSDAAGLTPAPVFFGSDTNSSSSSADFSDSFSGGDGGDSGGGGADGGGE